MNNHSLTINPALSDDAILAELGQRLSRHRIDAGLTQLALAEKAGISKSTLERIEAGAASQLPNLIRVLRALDMLAVLETAIPLPTPRPMALLRHQRKLPQRVRARQPANTQASQASQASQAGNTAQKPARSGGQTPAPADNDSPAKKPWTWGDERK
jgi:transcriptional regulator with XRE-family HTH domain